MLFLIVFIILVAAGILMMKTDDFNIRRIGLIAVLVGSLTIVYCSGKRVAETYNLKTYTDERNSIDYMLRTAKNPLEVFSEKQDDIDQLNSKIKENRKYRDNIWDGILYEPNIGDIELIEIWDYIGDNSSQYEKQEEATEVPECCTQCGQKIVEEAIYCSNCGEKIND